jgi:adenylate kinase family enzyme
MITRQSLARVAVVGTSGAGKSTLARALANALSSPHIELDAIYWGPNWTPIPEPDLRQRIDALTSQPRWVCDGNYSVVRDLVWPRATAIVWLNYSFPRVFVRALRRTLRRCLWREPVFGNNRETVRKSFLSRDSILVWILRTHWRHQQSYPRLFAEPAHVHLQVIELRAESDAQRLLAAARCQDHDENSRASNSLSSHPRS